MGIVFTVVLLLGVGLLLRSSQVRGCVLFLLWMALGMAAVWFILQFASGGLRI